MLLNFQKTWCFLDLPPGISLTLLTKWCPFLWSEVEKAVTQHVSLMALVARKLGTNLALNFGNPPSVWEWVPLFLKYFHSSRIFPQGHVIDVLYGKPPQSRGIEQHALSCYCWTFLLISGASCIKLPRRKFPLKPEPSSMGFADLWQLLVVGLL